MVVTIKSIDEVELEITRFNERLKAFRESRRFVSYHNEKDEKDGYYEHGVIESGALRRSSLDLTRSLARMRRV